MAKMLRTEKDSLGEVKIPEGFFYGASTQRAVENFSISGIRFSREFLRALAMIKIACAEVNLGLKKLDKKLAHAIVEASQRVERGELDEHFPLDIFQTGSGTSTNMNFNEVVANVANLALGSSLGAHRPVHPNDHVNLGQSSNDIIPTTIHVAAAMALSEGLVPALKRLEKGLLQKSKSFGDIIKSGRTHLQDAAPVTLGQEFSGYAAQITLSLERIASAQVGICELAVGGTAVGTGLNTDKNFGKKVSLILANRTKLPFREAQNHFEAQASKDACVFLSAALRSTAISLYKIANDVRFLSMGPRCGLGELQLPVVQPGSSIMPGKANPVIAESLLQVCTQVIGNDATIAMAGSAGNFELNVMMPVIAHNLLESIRLLSVSIDNFQTKCVANISANRDKIAEDLERNLMLATALVPVVGYDKATEVAKLAQATNQTVLLAAKQLLGMTEQELQKILNPKKLV